MVGPRSVEGHFRPEIKVFSVHSSHFETIVGLFVGAAGFFMYISYFSLCCIVVCIDVLFMGLLWYSLKARS